MGVLPTSGAAEAIALVMHDLSMSSDNDTRPVGISQPSFGAFRGLAALTGMTIETYDYHLDRGWMPDAAELLALARRCRALVIVNPHNPTGYVFPSDVLRDIADTLSAHGALLIVDEVFRGASETASAIYLGPHVIVMEVSRRRMVCQASAWMGCRGRRHTGPVEDASTVSTCP
jgi:aspartate/methionine/tyrosine aminotransferase